jgi:AbrB family looped-hinge helix DNA binding protein
METSKVSIKGQIVIPARLRKKYGFKAGEKVTFIEDDKFVIIKPKTKWVDICGSIKEPLFTPEEARKKISEMRENWR